MLNLILNDLSYYLFALIWLGFVIVAVIESKGGEK